MPDARLILSSSLLIALAASASVAAASPVPWDDIDRHIDQSEDNDDATVGGFAYGELLKNGTFDGQADAGTLNHWTPIVGDGPAWDALDGSIGAFPFGPADGGYFATTWTGTDSDWTLGVTRSTLAQTAALPVHANAMARVRVDALTARDTVRFDIEWLADDGAGGLSPLSSIDLGTYGGLTGGSVDAVDRVLDVPAGATHVSFRAEAILTDGYWVDAGFDNASIVMAQPVPEPTSAGLAGVALLACAARRRR